ncbi:hypothetical protein GJV26_19380 [Massilia dura]|uniref:Peptidase n=1 Tax=Pseudoduganella dura TaxID=321982 RepID=A0A6I3XCE2_9BURK|nr:hypothetical protein [Pseudoduganella dura]MUI14604.1 hypothetical protein [Pseudoduganella dura]GGY12149.1 hypothetical protein GCM10007386_48090 [Pseudoduganella dura]
MPTLTRTFASALLLSLTATTAVAAQLTALETRWLNAAAPVLDYARTLKLPIDIIVQPRAGPNDVPLAMGFADGRCKLVLSMRGNPNAETILAEVAEERRDVLIEAMAAHEVGHCWRYAQGNWHALPAGFTEVGQEIAANPELLALSKQMRETRREEGFSDLVALAWTQQRHPDQYAHVAGWLRKVRDDQPTSHGSHDTRPWLRLAPCGSAFIAGAGPFEQATLLWRKGLVKHE